MPPAAINTADLDRPTTPKLPARASPSLNNGSDRAPYSPTTPSTAYSPTNDADWKHWLSSIGGRLTVNDLKNLSVAICRLLEAELKSSDDKTAWHLVITHARFLLDTFHQCQADIEAELRNISTLIQSTQDAPAEFRCGIDYLGTPFECTLFEHYLALLRFHSTLRRVLPLSSGPIGLLLSNSRRQKAELLANAARNTFQEVISLLSLGLTHQQPKSATVLADPISPNLEQYVSDKISDAIRRLAPKSSPSPSPAPAPPSPPRQTPYTLPGDTPEQLTARAERALHGLGCTTRCPATAFHLLRLAVQRPPAGPNTVYAPAWYLLGSLHHSGLGTPNDPTAALHCYRRAAGIVPTDVPGTGAPPPTPHPAPSADALTALAHMYNLGDILPRDRTKAAELYLSAAKSGHVGAMTGLAGVALSANNLVRAIDWFSEAARRGCPSACVAMGNLASQVHADWESAAVAYAKAARLGSRRGMLALGVCYESGMGVPRDLVLAIQWYREAAAKGSAAAMANLGYMYWSQGRYWHGWQAWHQAVGMVTRDAEDAAEVGGGFATMDGRAEAMYMIGCVYENGCHFEPATGCVQAAPPVPPSVAALDATGQRTLGSVMPTWVPGDATSLFPGSIEDDTQVPFVLPASPSVAFAYFTRAGRMGHVRAMRRIAEYVRDGKDGVVEKNESVAISWGTRADEVEKRAREMRRLVVEGLDSGVSVKVPRLPAEVSKKHIGQESQADVERDGFRELVL